MLFCRCMTFTATRLPRHDPSHTCRSSTTAGAASAAGAAGDRMSARAAVVLDALHSQALWLQAFSSAETGALLHSLLVCFLALAAGVFPYRAK